jgi:hypothetical protein
MDINTGKLASNSSSFFKKIKENDSNKSSKLNDKNNESISKKILEDFNSVKYGDKDFKSKLIKINNQLSKYENELSKIQFIEQKISDIETLLKKKDQNAIEDIIKNSPFNGENVIKEYIPKLEKDVNQQIAETKKAIQDRYNELEKEFKTIEITSQNLMSIYSIKQNITDNSI